MHTWRPALCHRIGTSIVHWKSEHVVRTEHKSCQRIQQLPVTFLPVTFHNSEGIQHRWATRRAERLTKVPWHWRISPLNRCAAWEGGLPWGHERGRRCGTGERKSEVWRTR